MKRRRGGAQNEFEIPVTPLIDIVFLLLIYFLLASHFVHNQSLQVKLPESVAKATPIRKRHLTITITNNGHFILNGKEVALKDLTRAIKTECVEPGKTKCNIEADRQATVQMMVEAMDAAKLAGIKEVVVETRAKAMP